jgi:hypothetical protein
MFVFSEPPPLTADIKFNQNAWTPFELDTRTSLSGFWESASTSVGYAAQVLRDKAAAAERII